MTKTIEKKILPEFFDKVASGEKSFELRLADWVANGDLEKVEQRAKWTEKNRRLFVE